MASTNEAQPACTPHADINMSSPFVLRDWNEAFKLSTPIRSSPKHTPSKTSWKLGAPQRTPQARTPATMRTPNLSTRRVQQGAALASTPAQSGQRYLPKSKPADLIAPSLARLPNALDAEYWLNKIKAQEDLGNYQAAVDLFENASKRDVRPATAISRAYAEFLSRHNRADLAVTSSSPCTSHLRSSAVRSQSRFADQENSASHNIISQTPKTKKTDKQTRRQSRVHFQTPEANVVSEAADPVQDERNNSSKAGSTPFQAKSQRRVSFAAQSQGAEHTSTSGTAARASIAAVQTDGSSSVAKRRLEGNCEPRPDTSIEGLADSLVELASERSAVADAAVEAASEDSESDADDSCSAGTVSVAAGSTPFLNRHMLSAALRTSTPSEVRILNDAPNQVADNDDSAALSSMMARLLSAEWNSQEEHAGEFAGHAQIDQDQAAWSAYQTHDRSLNPETGAVHLTPAALPRSVAGIGLASDTRTPAAAGELFSSTSAALTPLCFDMGSLQLSATPSSQVPAHSTPASTAGKDDDADTPLPARAFSLAEGTSPAGETPAFPKAIAGWKQSVFDAPEDTMSPELLGWHEQHGIACEQGLAGAASSASPESESKEQPPSFQFTRTPASAIKGKRAAEGSALGKAVRVKTPANRARVGKSELRGLAGSSPPRAARDMGSIALLSPVRADGRINQQLGAAKVITPVRRSARKSAATPLIASMLRETEFAYAPNEALSRRRHPIFDTPTEATAADVESVQQEDDIASTPTSITGVSLAGDVSIPAESPALQAEASATTSHSPSPLPQNPPDSSALLEAALSPELGTDSIPHFGCLHHLHAASNLISGSIEGMATEGKTLKEMTNTSLANKGLVTPPPPPHKVSPKGPTTRSKSARKAAGVPVAARIGARQRRAVDSPSLSPTEAKIREGLRRSARLQRDFTDSAE